MARFADQNAEGDALLLRLRRLEARARTVRRSDRAQLIALIGDIEAVRRGLARQRALIDAKLKKAATRSMAILAYARGAGSAARSNRH